MNHPTDRIYTCQHSSHGTLAGNSSMGPPRRIDPTTHRTMNERSFPAGTRNSSMCPPLMIDPTTHLTMSERSYHGATSRSCQSL